MNVFGSNMGVKIVILGINHNDPLGRKKIVSLLNELKNEEFIPDCIATEWDKNIAQSIIKQRNGFIKYAEEKAPYLHKETLESLATALAYEADSHTDIYPNLPIIWLDEGSTYFRTIEYYSQDRLSIYIDAINKLNRKDKNNLELISRNIWSIGYSGNASERDIKFFDKIINAVENEYKNLLIIVGARHANTEIENSLVDRLMKKGFNIRLFILI